MIYCVHETPQLPFRELFCQDVGKIVLGCHFDHVNDSFIPPHRQRLEASDRMPQLALVRFCVVVEVNDRLIVLQQHERVISFEVEFLEEIREPNSFNCRATGLVQFCISCAGRNDALFRRSPQNWSAHKQDKTSKTPAAKRQVGEVGIGKQHGIVPWIL